MMESRTEKVKSICDANVERGCRECCPLAGPCASQAGDTEDIFIKRMNEAAETRESSG